MAGSDYVCRPVFTSPCRFKFLTDLLPAGSSGIGPQDNIVLYLADLTTGDILLDVDMSLEEYCLVYEYGTPVEPYNDSLRRMDLLRHLYDSHVYSPSMFVRPWSAPP